MKAAIPFDNHDARIKYHELTLERDLNNPPCFMLPAGYRFVFFGPGDRDAWIEIEISAKELSDHEQGVEVWNRYYGGNENTLSERMVFVENEEGEKVATATAYYDVMHSDKCKPSNKCTHLDKCENSHGGVRAEEADDGWLHWVAVRREYQGKGLSKPLISHTLGVMRGLGYTHAIIPTQTTTWLACKIYLDFGFRPTPESAAAGRDGWRIIKALTDHEALADFDAAGMDEIIRD